MAYNRLTTDHIHQIFEKDWENKGTVPQSFTDFKNVYDSVRREVLHNILIWRNASICSRKRIVILNNVHQHSCFIVQHSYIGYMFRLIDQSYSGLFCRLSHSSKQQLDGNGTWILAGKRQILFKKFFKHFNHIVTQYVHHTSLGNWSDFMYFIDVKTLGSQCVHSTLWLNLLNRPEDDWSISRNM